MNKTILIAIIALCLALPGVNFYHHLVLPTSVGSQITEYKQFSLSSWDFISTHTDIRLGETIHAFNFPYFEIQRVLQDAKRGDTITFHLAGYGGSVEQTLLLMNNVMESKAYVTMSVEAPVYSGHAYLATSGNCIKMSPFSYLMYHSSSVLNVDCSQATGMDRGVSNVEHCVMMYLNEIIVNSAMVDSNKLLTKEEKAIIMKGHDVYLQSYDVNQRCSDGVLRKYE